VYHCNFLDVNAVCHVNGVAKDGDVYTLHNTIGGGFPGGVGRGAAAGRAYVTNSGLREDKR